MKCFHKKVGCEIPLVSNIVFKVSVNVPIGTRVLTEQTYCFNIKNLEIKK